MSNVPETLAEFIPWAQNHKDLWTTNQAQINLSSSQIAAFKALVDALVATSTAAGAARLASKNATGDLNNADTAARVVASAYVNLIKGFAQTSGNPKVYTLAGIEPDAPPGTPPAPVPPTQFNALLNSDGSLTIKWKASQPAGVSSVVYQITRKLTGETTFTPVGSIGSAKTFTDKTIPFGTDSVSYIATPVRGNVVGQASDSFEVRFGSVGGGGGGFAITSTSQAPTTTITKLAA